MDCTACRLTMKTQIITCQRRRIRTSVSHLPFKGLIAGTSLLIIHMAYNNIIKSPRSNQLSYALMFKPHLSSQTNEEMNTPILTSNINTTNGTMVFVYITHLYIENNDYVLIFMTSLPSTPPNSLMAASRINAASSLFV